MRGRRAGHTHIIRLFIAWILLSAPMRAQAQPVPLDPEPAWVSEGEYRSGALAWADVDADGDLDLASGNYCFQPMCFPEIPSKIHIYINRGGLLEPAPSWASDDELWTTDLVWGDVDADGDPDLFAASGGPRNDPNVIYINHDGLLETTPSWVSSDQTATLAAGLADLNSDGYLDAAVTNQCYHPCTGAPSNVYYSAGALMSASPSWSSEDEEQNSGLALGDVDEDGLQEVTETADGDGARRVFYLRHAPVHLLRGITVGVAEAGIFTFDPVSGWVAFAEPPRAGSGNVSFEYVRSDDLELAVSANPGSNKLYSFQNGQHETAASWRSQGNSRTNSVVRFADTDNDSDIDLFVAGRSHPCVIYKNAGGVLSDAPVWSTEQSDPDVHDAAFADVDGDGLLDLATANYTGNPAVMVFLNRNGTLETTPSWTVPRLGGASAASLAWGDMNGDGRPDLAVGYVTGPVRVFLNRAEAPGPAPALDSIDPGMGYNSTATPVTLRGQNFQQGALVTVADTYLRDVAVEDPTRLTGIVPPGIPPGRHDVILRNPDIQSAKLAGGFEVLEGGGEPDAGVAVDAGTPQDGDLVDAGHIERGDELDAGLAEDAGGEQPDAGSTHPAKADEGCSCAAGATTTPLSLLVSAILAYVGVAAIRLRSARLRSWRRRLKGNL